VRLGDRRGEGLSLIGLGSTALAAGDLDRATGFLRDAADTFRRAGDRWGLSSALWRWSELELARDDVEAARERLEEALKVVDETRRLRWQSVTRASLAEVALLLGDLERAVALFELALHGFAARRDEEAAAYVRGRLDALKPAQRGRKGAAATTGATRSTKRRNS
jgi:tetratricopeptide (TPR) repeat protein